MLSLTQRAATLQMSARSSSSDCIRMYHPPVVQSGTPDFHPSYNVPLSQVRAFPPVNTGYPVSQIPLSVSTTNRSDLNGSTSSEPPFVSPAEFGFTGDGFNDLESQSMSEVSFVAQMRG